MNLEQLPAYWIADLKRYLIKYRTEIEEQLKVTPLHMELDGYQITIYTPADIDSIVAQA